MAPQIFAGMIMMMLCGLIDLYFVAGLGDAAIAGVGAAGNAGFLINALTQILSVGTVSLISQAVGRKDRADANLVFNQSLGLSAAGTLFTLIAGCLLARSYMRSIAADDAVIEAGTTYLYLVHAGTGAAIRRAGDGLCVARHRHRASHRDRADHHGDHQYAAGAGSDHGLGHGSGAGRRRRGSGEHDRGRDRRGDDVDLFPPLRALRCHQQRIVASATWRNGSAYWASGCRPEASSPSYSSIWR